MGVVSRRTVLQAVIPQEQVTGILALQAHAAGVPQVGHALLAQGVAVWREQGTGDTERQHRGLQEGIRDATLRANPAT